MFATPMYNSLLLDQSLAFNRRRDEDSVEIEGVEASVITPEYTQLTSEDKTDMSKVRKEDTIPKIFTCATMWHETRVSRPSSQMF
jgi:chitin synthase